MPRLTSMKVTAYAAPRNANVSIARSGYSATSSPRMNTVTMPRDTSCNVASTKPLTACLTSERMFAAKPAVLRLRKKTYGLARYSRSRRTERLWLRFHV